MSNSSFPNRPVDVVAGHDQWFLQCRCSPGRPLQSRLVSLARFQIIVGVAIRGLPCSVYCHTLDKDPRKFSPWFHRFAKVFSLESFPAIRYFNRDLSTSKEFITRTKEQPSKNLSEELLRSYLWRNCWRNLLRSYYLWRNCWKKLSVEKELEKSTEEDVSDQTEHVFCEQCNNSNCTTCSIQRHRVGKRKEHFIGRLSKLVTEVVHVPLHVSQPQGTSFTCDFYIYYAGHVFARVRLNRLTAEAQTDRHTQTQTDKQTTVTLLRMRRGLIKDVWR